VTSRATAIQRSWVIKDHQTYHDLSETIDEEINKRRGSWYTTNIPGLDWDDVAQIIKLHISNKWTLWDQSRSFKPWVNQVITNRLKNVFRDTYSNYMPPCVRCEFNQNSFDETGECSITTSKKWSNECPLYAKWESGKKHAWNIKIRATLEHHDNESINDNSLVDSDLEGMAERLHEKMEAELSQEDYSLYDMIYLKHMDRADIAIMLGYKPAKTKYSAGYKYIKEMEKSFTATAKRLLEEGLF